MNTNEPGPSDLVNANASVTGKPLSRGGIAGRTEATGRGVQYAIHCYLRDLDFHGVGGQRDLSSMTVVVQGFGNVGYYAAKLLSEEDRAKVVCIVERDGFIFNAGGLDVEAVQGVSCVRPVSSGERRVRLLNLILF